MRGLLRSARIPFVLLYSFLFPLPLDVLTPGCTDPGAACQTPPRSGLLRASHIQAAPGWGSRCSPSWTTSSYKHHPHLPHIHFVGVCAAVQGTKPEPGLQLAQCKPMAIPPVSVPSKLASRLQKPKSPSTFHQYYMVVSISLLLHYM